MRRSPVGLDDPAFGAIAQDDPIAEPVGPAQAQGDAGEYVAERILQRQPQDYGEDPDVAISAPTGTAKTNARIASSIPA